MKNIAGKAHNGVFVEKKGRANVKDLCHCMTVLGQAVFFDSGKTTQCGSVGDERPIPLVARPDIRLCPGGTVSNMPAV